ncbi:MAG: hypothetical protein ABI847_17415, partial [Anaerolineales bacterium]
MDFKEADAGVEGPVHGVVAVAGRGHFVGQPAAGALGRVVVAARLAKLVAEQARHQEHVWVDLAQPLAFAGLEVGHQHLDGLHARLLDHLERLGHPAAAGVGRTVQAAGGALLPGDERE